jgi:hypothetical protein
MRKTERERVRKRERKRRNKLFGIVLTVTTIDTPIELGSQFFQTWTTIKEKTASTK